MNLLGKIKNRIEGQRFSLEEIFLRESSHLKSSNTRESFVSGLYSLCNKLISLKLDKRDREIVDALKVFLDNSHKIVFKRIDENVFMDSELTQPSQLYSLPRYIRDFILTELSRFGQGQANEVSYRQPLTRPILDPPVPAPEIKPVPAPETYPVPKLPSSGRDLLPFLESIDLEKINKDELADSFRNFLDKRNLDFIYSYFLAFPEISDTTEKLLLSVKDSTSTLNDVEGFDYSSLQISAPLSSFIERSYFIMMLKRKSLDDWKRYHSPEGNFFDNKSRILWIETFSKAKNPEDIVLLINKLRSELVAKNLDTIDLDSMLHKFSKLRLTVENHYTTNVFDENFPYSLGLERIYKKMYEDIRKSNIDLRKRLGLTNEKNIENASRIYACSSFKQLTDEIEKNAYILGIDGLPLEKNLLIEIINRIGNGDVQFYLDNILTITNFLGIRNKVQELFTKNFIPESETKIIPASNESQGFSGVTAPLPNQNGLSDFTVPGDSQPKIESPKADLLHKIRNSKPFLTIETFFENIGILKKPDI